MGEGRKQLAVLSNIEEREREVRSRGENWARAFQAEGAASAKT